ncbi:hypothetical protein NA57DRAFT_76050 [Rhizodiscina lignyota]|uniref:DUF6594 domain-containing protein n=1 Tax=Rhizodiscina lignyota TaxID=1504668 RepID=A0A9P4IFQ3_9PEZI|nr:hypothetical protein NA57DRAFT_76050 [Rhizodiscina lignyota]
MAEAEGYYALAKFLDEEAWAPILRRFGVLNTQNLLYMQAELFHLERELQSIALEDAQAASSDPRHDFRYSVLDLRNSAATVDNPQWNKILEIREKLEKYNDAVIRYHKIRAMSGAQKLDIKNTQHILNIVKHKKFFLKNTDIEAWAGQNKHDLIALSDNQPDQFTSWVRGPFLSWLHNVVAYRFIKEDPNSELTMYADTTIFLVVNLLRCTLATLFPAATTIALYVVKSIAVRLVLVFLFTALFTLVISCLTMAKTVELFMATATFAAVQVVFISTTNSSTNSS